MEKFSDLEVQRFEGVRKAMGVGTGKPFREILNTIPTELPDAEEQDQFHAWMDARYKADCDLRNRSGMTAEEFVQQVDSVNLLNATVTDKLVKCMEERKIRHCIPIGFDDNVIYRLDPGALRLLPHLRPKNDWEDDEDIVVDAAGRPLLPPCFLGINTTVQPREPAVPANRRKANLSEVSAHSAESDDADAPGFAFFQLGDLEYVRRRDNLNQHGLPDCDGRDEQRGAVSGLDWLPTNFVLVARLSPSGHADGIYAVYDMFQDDMPASDDRQLITHPAWGIPPTGWDDSGDQFSCARVGGRLSDFGKDHQMVWTDKIEHPVELVRVLRSIEGRPLRATVDERARWAGMKPGK